MAAGPALWTPGWSVGLGWSWSYHVPPWSRSLLKRWGLPAQLHGHEGVPGASEPALHLPQALSSSCARPGRGAVSSGAPALGVGGGSCGLRGRCGSLRLCPASASQGP